MRPSPGALQGSVQDLMFVSIFVNNWVELKSKCLFNQTRWPEEDFRDKTKPRCCAIAFQNDVYCAVGALLTWSTWLWRNVWYGALDEINYIEVKVKLICTTTVRFDCFSGRNTFITMTSSQKKKPGRGDSKTLVLEFSKFNFVFGIMAQVTWDIAQWVVKLLSNINHRELLWMISKCRSCFQRSCLVIWNKPKHLVTNKLLVVK